ncbi:hypothetical protein TH25_04470 [Thalassospira profundimaris]|uniref:Uncharacterized protein n=1 Tax=Thalassospira profundimaris TaxID=502049 RepID=A0A367XJD9_9PROT|nr:hypothetical protein TH25_04470 [Thalassospira profundimaris]
MIPVPDDGRRGFFYVAAGVSRRAKADITRATIGNDVIMTLPDGIHECNGDINARRSTGIGR